jgi:hypothetical protein
LLLVLAAAGCEQQEPIREYVVRRPAEVGIHWSFKLVGPQAAVAGVAEEFRKFVEGVTFDSETGVPQWTLPAGWTEVESQSTIRFKTIRLPGATPLEIAVLQVSGQVPPRPAEVVQQANMFRAQVGLESLPDAASSLDNERTGKAVDDILAGNYPGHLFNYAGKDESGSELRLVAAIVPVPVTAAMADAATASRTLPFTYQSPAEWQEAPQTQFSVVSMSAGTGTDAVAFTITPAQGGVIANVNRWREQADLPEITEAQLPTLIELVGDESLAMAYIESIGAKRSILGGILAGDQGIWFFKLDGKPAPVESEKERFKALLETVRIVE